MSKLESAKVEESKMAEIHLSSDSDNNNDNGNGSDNEKEGNDNENYGNDKNISINNFDTAEKLK